MTYFQGKRMVDNYLDQFQDLIYDSGGVGRVVAEGPELVARSDSEGGELWYCVCVLITNMNMFLRKVT